MQKGCFLQVIRFTITGEVPPGNLVMVSSALATVYQQLMAFAGLESFWSNFEAVFGTEYDVALAESLRSPWRAGDFSQLPPIEVISGDILGNARGAYARSRNTIYLADWFVAGATADAVGTVILEEIGHFVDAQVNVVDTAGDEGELFSAFAQGKTLAENQPSRLRAEDDTATININGEPIEIEQSEQTIDFIGQWGGSFNAVK